MEDENLIVGRILINGYFWIIILQLYDLIDERLFFARKIKMEIKEPNSDLSKSCKFISLEFLANKKMI